MRQRESTAITTSTPGELLFPPHITTIRRDIGPCGIFAVLVRSAPRWENADVEEFHAVLDTLGIEDAERFKCRMTGLVPVRRIPQE